MLDINKIKYANKYFDCNYSNNNLLTSESVINQLNYLLS